MDRVIDKISSVELQKKNTIIFQANADFIREALKMHISKRQIHAYLRKQNILDTCFSNFARMCRKYLENESRPSAAGRALDRMEHAAPRPSGPLINYRPELANQPGYDR